MLLTPSAMCLTQLTIQGACIDKQKNQKKKNPKAQQTNPDIKCATDTFKFTI